MCQNVVVEEKYQQLQQFIDSLPDSKADLIAVLHKAQGLFGYLPEEIQLYIAEQLDIPASKVYGVVSFYSFFITRAPGEHVISICMGTACYVKGADRILEEVEKCVQVKAGATSADGKFSVDVLRCVGCCGLAPVVIVDGKVYGNVKPKEIKQIIDQYR